MSLGMNAWKREQLGFRAPSRKLHGDENGGRGGGEGVNGCRVAKLSHLKNDRPRVLYRAGDGAETKPSKKSHVLCVPRRPFPRFAALEIDRRPISDHPLPSIRLKIIDSSPARSRGRVVVSKNRRIENLVVKWIVDCSNDTYIYI